ncbi:hypothetical protein GCM10010449_52870 [Streptomyces rectiviolaceus]|uniref:Secreted protein n=1 Tax=Streptomyces rectiviolaceus TaxID=332591 RepID=A0ABP6MVT4_9ACTN
MRRTLLSCLAAAALAATAIPLATSTPASAAAVKCTKQTKKWKVAVEKAPVHFKPSQNSSIVRHRYKDNPLTSYWSCTNSSANPWVCVASCVVDDGGSGAPRLEGEWIFQPHLRKR